MSANVSITSSSSYPMGDPKPSLGMFSSSASFCTCGNTAGCINTGTYIAPSYTCGMCGVNPCTCANTWTSWIGSGASTYNWPTTSILTKGKSKADILGDFFGKGVHALAIMGEEKDGGATFVQFMDKFNMIWLQSSVGSWCAYDRTIFIDWANSENTVFNGVKLSKEEVIKRMMRQEPEPTNE